MANLMRASTGATIRWTATTTFRSVVMLEDHKHRPKENGLSGCSQEAEAPARHGQERNGYSTKYGIEERDA